jgi:ribosomal-protein-alanine N-acetyltransferase
MHQEIRPAPPPPPRDPAPLTSKPDTPLTEGGGGGGGSGSGSGASSSTHILRTHRLSLRHLTLADAPFILSLVNDASWLRFIGDRNVHSLQDAERYLKDGPFAMHAKYGHSLWAVTLADSDAAIGMCGLLKRDCLRHADVGYALLPQWRGQGYAREAAAATLQHGHDVLGMKRIVAVCSMDNDKSIR